MLKPIDYDDRQHEVYAKARAMAPDMLQRWMDRFAAALPDRRPLRLLDLGCGIGRFTPALAERFGGPATGVEPSARMRAVAEATAAAPGVRYLAGQAEAIPLPDAAVDGVLMFLSFHHFADRRAAAREIARVLAADGRVLMRGVFPDRSPDDWWFPFFPRLREIRWQMFPTLSETTAIFAEAGLRALEFVEVQERYSATPEQALERLRLRGISSFDHLTEAELAEGFARLDAAHAAGELEVPLSARSDLLVLGA